MTNRINLYIIINVIFIFVHMSHRSMVKSSSVSEKWSIHFGNVDLFDIPAFGNFGINSQTTVTGTTLGYDFQNSDVLEDAHLTTPELVQKYGYPNETHHIVTEDGYILEVHRIAKPGGKAVLLNHGLLDSSATWIMMGPDKGLGYFLYDNGFDVWMMNVRGNTYSRNHTKYNTKEGVFWNFSFHEIGKYDIPATIDYILRTTKYERLQYIGHSQGTLTYWIMCSERPDYVDRVELMQALAPIAFINHSRSPVIDFLAFFQEPLQVLLKLIGAHEFLPSNEFIQMFTAKCDADTWTKDVCSNIIFLFTGFDKSELNETMVPVILGHTPSGTSTKQVQHYGQLKHSGKLRQFDYGWIRNYWKYDAITPPDYKLERVRNRVVLHHSANDWLSTEKDVEHLAKALPNLVGKYLVDFKKFNHLDFVWAVDARELLYKRVLNLMKTNQTYQSIN